MFLIVALIYFSTSNAQIIKAEIKATGLTCSMCSNAINKQLKSLSEVVSTETDLNTNTFIVTLKEDNKLTPTIFKEKVENAGFFIGSLLITAKPNALNSSIYIGLNDSKSAVDTLRFQVLDKGYVTTKEYKKLVKTYVSISTYALNNEDDFHIKILN